jgi:hypothetical protein
LLLLGRVIVTYVLSVLGFVIVGLVA